MTALSSSTQAVLSDIQRLSALVDRLPKDVDGNSLSLGSQVRWVTGKREVTEGKGKRKKTRTVREYQYSFDPGSVRSRDIVFIVIGITKDMLMCEYKDYYLAACLGGSIRTDIGPIVHLRPSEVELICRK